MPYPSVIEPTRAPAVPVGAGSPRPLRNPQTRRNHRRAAGLVALAVVMVAASALAVVTAVGYDREPSLVGLVHADDRMKEFTRLSDREIQDLGREVCADLVRGRTPFEVADGLTGTLGLGPVAGTTFVEVAASHGCPGRAGY